MQTANILKLALFTGMRRGELFNLKWEDIDFDNGFITIRNPKGGLNQIIPFNDNTKDIFDSHPKSESDYVFPGRVAMIKKDPISTFYCMQLVHISFLSVQ